jgi:hypothetical protein
MDGIVMNVEIKTTGNMRFEKMNVDELSYLQGGSWAYEAGQWASEQWCSFKSFVRDCGMSASQASDYRKYRGL